MSSQNNGRLTPADCLREATFYAGQALSEPQIGTRTALLRVARNWQDIADQIENLDIVRQINTAPTVRGEQ